MLSISYEDTISNGSWMYLYFDIVYIMKFSH